MSRPPIQASGAQVLTEKMFAHSRGRARRQYQTDAEGTRTRATSNLVLSRRWDWLQKRPGDAAASRSTSVHSWR